MISDLEFLEAFAAWVLKHGAEAECLDMLRDPIEAICSELEEDDYFGTEGYAHCLGLD